MRKLTLAAVAVSLAGLGACATAPVDPALIAAANRTITCNAGADCDAKWSRAVGWVARNSGWKIQTQTDNLIQTFGPGSDGSTDLAYTVSKIAGTGGTYTIEVSTACANLFGCVPDDVTQRAAFVEFVTAP